MIGYFSLFPLIIKVMSVIGNLSVPLLVDSLFHTNVCDGLLYLVPKVMKLLFVKNNGQFFLSMDILSGTISDFGVQVLQCFMYKSFRSLMIKGCNSCCAEIVTLGGISALMFAIQGL
jgi:hypothetical protein